MKLKKFAFCAFLGLSTVTFADQAAYIEKSDSTKVVSLLKSIDSVKFFCNPCGDRYAEEVEVKSFSNRDVNFEGYWEVQINGEGVDLAYTYFPENGRWRNAAIMLDLDVQDVPEFIK